MNRTELLSILQSKRDWVVVYLWAPWCVPCATAGPLIEAHATRLPDKVTYLKLNTDTCFDVYAALKAKKQVRGIPALLGYKPDNGTLLADEACSGANEADIAAFFSKLS